MGASQGRSRDRLTTTITGAGASPRDARSAAASGRARNGPYGSARTVAAPTRIASLSRRTSESTSRSVVDEIDPLRPSAPATAPSSVITIITRSQEPAAGHG